ncbi:MAG: hypothetical protein OER96_12625 [Gammaproteobacteria bacterium]|nr:hypothetical protein [Gammaproteobacteria bacterium]
MQVTEQRQKGALNLLRNCIDVQPGQSVLLVVEPDDSFYNSDVVDIVEYEAKQLGADISIVKPALIDGPEAFPDSLANEVNESNHTIFLSRIGDNIRFTRIRGRGSKTICYALDADFLGSEFCTMPHDGMQTMLDNLLDDMDSASEWRITCPLGTKLTGTFQNKRSRRTIKDNAFTLGTFPIVIIPPIPCDTMNGRAVITHWLMATSNRHYEPSTLILDQPVTVFIENGKILDFEGDDATITNVRKHYQHVAGLFDIEPYNIHSWHAGVNSMTYYPRPAMENIEHWGAVAFASPRYTHFHTCGDYAPGEIAWSMFDTTIYVDNEKYWEDGRFVYLERLTLENHSVNSTLQNLARTNKYIGID